MIVKTYNFGLVKEVLYDDEIWPRISEDGQEKNLNLDVEGFDWYEIKEDGKVIGILLTHQLFKFTLQAHIQILKRYRQYSESAGRDIIDLFLATENEKMEVTIPVIYQDVFGYVKKFGFILEGISRGSILKNGKMTDQYNMGLTRQEAIRWAQQQQ